MTYRQVIFRTKLLLPLAAAGLLAAPAPVVAAAAPSPSGATGQPPAGFTQSKAVGINYVRGGHGPTLVLLHGYPQTWYEWRHVMPALSRHYTVIAPDLPGAGGSDAPAAGYDKKTMAASVHALLAELGLDRGIRLVGHDIGSMVAYSYAAAHPKDVAKLVLSEAPIPDRGIYRFTSLTRQGPGAWHFGFFNLANGLPEDVIRGREKTWVDRFVDSLEVRKGAVTQGDIDVFAGHLRDRARLEASLAWFRTLPQDVRDNAVYRRTKLTMPVLAVGAKGSLGDLVPNQTRRYASRVTGVVVPESGHWLYEEQPAEMTRILLRFLA